MAQHATMPHESMREISDASAVAIASWWQAPSGTGYVLAGFASGCVVDRDELLDDIAATRREADAEYHTDEERTALDCLSTFVLHYGK
jgi:hypothetical protein